MWLVGLDWRWQWADLPQRHLSKGWAKEPHCLSLALTQVQYLRGGGRGSSGRRKMR